MSAERHFIKQKKAQFRNDDYLLIIKYGYLPKRTICADIDNNHWNVY